MSNVVTIVTRSSWKVNPKVNTEKLLTRSIITVNKTQLNIFTVIRPFKAIML